MRVAVVTPYFKEPIDKLRRCHDSVLQQSHGDVTHIMVADGHPRKEIDAWDRCQHFSLPFGHNDSGDTPRVVGCSSAAAQKFDAIVLLDADNWFDPTHIAMLLRVQEQSAAPVVTCSRKLVRPDTGEFIGNCRESNGVEFTDPNCLLLTQDAFPLLAAWGFRDGRTTASVGNMGDRLFWQAIVRSRIRRAHSSTLTVNYETSYASHYAARGLPIPEFAKVIVWLTDEQRMRCVPFAEYLQLLEQGRVPDQGFASASGGGH